MTTPPLEDVIRHLTQPLNGQYPRPWMTDLTDPACAEVFIVGRNQATGYPADALTHEDHMDALFNRNGRSCRSLYEQMRAAEGKPPSPTRRNTDALVERLRDRGVTALLETNVICYSTPMSAALRDTSHAGGAARGTEIFRTLLDTIRPRVLIAHGTGTAKDLQRLLGLRLPAPPTAATNRHAEAKWVDSTAGHELKVFVIPALSPPGWNRWARWAPAYLDRLADDTATTVNS